MPNAWVADSDVQKKNFRKFLTREEPQPKTATFLVSWAHRKSFNERCAFRWAQPTRYQKTQTRKVSGFWKLIPYILQDVEIFAEFSSEITRESRAEMAEINAVRGRL